jgi:hypothetical protein
MHVEGFLGALLEAETTGADALAETEENGTVTRTLRYALGETAKILVSQIGATASGSGAPQSKLSAARLSLRTNRYSSEKLPRSRI